MKKLWLYCICLLLTAPTLAAVKQVQGGADLRRAIRSLGGNDTLVVAAGNYTIDEIVTVGNNTVIMGEEGARPSIELETFRIGTEASRLVFRNLDLKLRSRFLVGMLSQADVDIDLIAFESCSIDLGGETGAGLVGGSSTVKEKNRIGMIRVDDCMVFNGGFPLHFVYTAGSSSQTRVEQIVLRNSTFSDMARGVVVSSVAMQTRVVIDHCTFYNINRQNNNAGTIRLSSARADVCIDHSLFTFAGADSRFVLVGNGSSVSVTDSYMTAELTSISGSHGLKRIPTTAAETFEAPYDDPTDPQASFRISREAIPDGTPGDPKWNQKN